MLKSFFVPINESAHAIAALQYACFLASAAHGKIHIGHIIEPTFEPAIAAGMMSGGIDYVTPLPATPSAEEIAQHRKEREALAEKLFEQARQVCAEWPVTCETGCWVGYLEEEILKKACCVDLIAIGQSSVGGDRRQIGQLTELVVRSSPQPVLIATAPFTKPSGVIVLFNSGERALHALGVGADIAALAGLPLTLVTLAPTRDEAEVVDMRGRQYLDDHEVVYKGEIIASTESPHNLLLKKLNDQPEALVLMAAFEHSRLKEWLAGSTTRTILQETRNPLMLFRH